MQAFALPPAIATLVAARNKVREHYQRVLRLQECDAELKFTLDGNLVGDIGEAIAVELFGITLVQAKSTEGIDGYAPDGRTVQIKATGTGRGPAFRCTETRADHLLFFDLDFTSAVGTVVFNGPEHYAIRYLPPAFLNQRSLSPSQIRAANRLVALEERLEMVANTALGGARQEVEIRYE
jgi:hypothetical protein